MINDLRGKYRPLSNFWSCFITYEGRSYPSVENAYQAAKMQNSLDKDKFLYCKASEAKQLGKLLPLRSDWEYERYLSWAGHVPIKVTVMYELVKQKFFNNSSLANLLVETGEEEIQEGNWWGDNIWGTVNGEGINYLGKILMQVRKELNELRFSK
jgi:N-glycosidase YbiA